MAASFGKDSVTVLHMLRDIKPDIEVIYLNAGYEFPETLMFIERLKQDLNGPAVGQALPKREESAASMWALLTALNTKTKERRVVMAKDVVCGMEVDPKKAAGKSEYQGQTYYFCSRGCKAAFDKEPQKYVGRAQGHGVHRSHY
ncbi:MAG: YHS domain-containing protein [Anaerolineae bacterium]|nr:YHS domain-containing protein [Anaerolineae bacterium]